MFLFYLWYVIVIVQGIFSWGTAYRLTKYGGDNGVALWGWSIALGLASLIPGLGIYLWYKYREYNNSRYDQQRYVDGER